VNVDWCHEVRAWTGFCTHRDRRASSPTPVTSLFPALLPSTGYRFSASGRGVGRGPSDVRIAGARRGSRPFPTPTCSHPRSARPEGVGGRRRRGRRRVQLVCKSLCCFRFWGIIPIGRPTPPPRPDCLMTTALSLGIFPIAGRRRHKQTALAVGFAASCVLSPIPMSVLSAQTQVPFRSSRRQPPHCRRLNVMARTRSSRALSSRRPSRRFSSPISSPRPTAMSRKSTLISATM